MAKRRQKAKRSLAALPKGLPQRRKHGLSIDSNPFEVSARQKRAKHEVHNRQTAKQTNKQTALARSIQRRRSQLQETLATSKKANAFLDRRIGEYNMTPEQQMMARLVKERSRRSKRAAMYTLDDDNEAPLLTHKGRAIEDFNDRDHVILSDDEEEGNLDAVDTELHFGGGSFGRENSAYGPGTDSTDMTQVYSQRKTELDDLIARRKVMKAERMKSKEEQVEVFENMDDSFKEIASLLQFRDKAKERKQQEDEKRDGTLTKEDTEMAEWDKELKEYLFERRVKATDRTKTPEEKAKEEAERLHELETRRLARMNGDFQEDDFSDISDDDMKRSKKRKKKESLTKKRKERNPDELDDSGDEEEDAKVKFTADGLVYVDKDGNAVKKIGKESGDSSSDSSSSNEDGSSKSEIDEGEEQILAVGTKVKGNYRVKEQFEQQAAWYDGEITAVNKHKDGSLTYDVTYEDGDFEEDMEPENVRAIEASKEDQEQEASRRKDELSTKRKRQKAKDKAR